MTKFGAGIDGLGSVSNGAFDWKNETSRLARISRPPSAPTFRQMSSEVLVLAFLRIDILIDCLMAQSGRCATGEPESAGNLFRRPAILQAFDNGGAKSWIAQQLAILASTVGRHPMCRDVPVSFGDRHITIMPEIAPQFTADCRTVTAKGACDLGLTDLLLSHPSNDAAFVQTQLHKRAGHSILLKPWPSLSSLHLKMESAPATCPNRISIIMELCLWARFDTSGRPPGRVPARL